MLRVAKFQGRFPAVDEAASIYTMHEALRGYCPEGGGETSQLDLPSLTPLSVDGCGRLQPGVSVDSVDFSILQQV